jgi:hypothetical protein
VRHNASPPVAETSRFIAWVDLTWSLMAGPCLTDRVRQPRDI